MSVMRVCAANSIFLGAALSLFAASTAVAEDELESVVVTAARVAQPISEVIGSVTVIAREEIEKRQVQSVQDLLRGEAGIDISNQGGLGKLSSIFMRGANSSQTLILVDGVRLGSATAGTTAIEFIPVDQIERVEIVRGPRSSLYGSDAMGGVIQIFTRKNDGVTASVGTGSYSTQNYGAGFGMQGDALRFSVNGNYVQSEGFDACSGDPLTFQGCYTIEPDNDGYRNSSATAQLGYAFGKFADLELNTLYAQGFTQYDGDFQNETRFRQTAPNLRLRVNASDTIGLTLTGGITQDRSEAFKDSVFASRINTEKRNAGAQVDWKLGRHQLSAGADYLNDIVDSNIAYTKTERDNTGIFAQYLGKLGKHEISASARHDDNEQFGTHNTGNLGWKWFALERALAFNAGWGTAFHAPTFNDLYFPADPYSAPNPDLKPESSKSIELGASGMYAWLSWSLQAFHTETEDLIVGSSAPPDYIYTLHNVSEARMRGVELMLSGTWDKLTASLNYTAQNPRSREMGANYDHILPRRARQSGRIDLSYDLGTAQIGSIINVAGKRYDDLANTIVLPGYTTLDFVGNVALGRGFAVQVKLANFLDRQYETSRYFNQEGRSVYLTLRYQPK